MSYYINDYKRVTISNIFIWLSLLFTVLYKVVPDFYLLGMNHFFINQWKYHIYFIQFFSSNFIHWGAFHLFFNSIYIYYFWNQVEIMLGKNKYTAFFIFNAIFVWIWLTLFSGLFDNTIWISGFCLALLSYYTLELRARKIDDYRWWITAIILNLAFSFILWISPLGHLFWAIAWVIFYYINKNFLRKVLTFVK